ncbi:MAG: right-handed parallel beta-helix repeat-containing protein [Acidobacteriota bacterium]|nr:right-handed parallel beta-helix repeat-containing protein [Blastocatellia bacterium]MDW8238557.1 right-handed parallel beta-helix repeat-containing protein [Acidobacteriota bacterium]
MKRSCIVSLASVVGLSVLLHTLYLGEGVDLKFQVPGEAAALAADIEHSLWNTYPLLSDQSNLNRLNETLQSYLARPLSLASADFDEDGMDDLAVGYACRDGGLLTLHRGNVAALWPKTHQETGNRRKEKGESTDHSIFDPPPRARHSRPAGDPFSAFLSVATGDMNNSSNIAPLPFLPEPLLIQLPAAPQMLIAGDFNADGHADLIMATAGNDAIEFYAGDGHAGFANAHSIQVGGPISALSKAETTASSNHPANAGIVVGIVGEGPVTLVFDPRAQAWLSKPMSLAPSGEPTHRQRPTADDGLNASAETGGRDIIAALPMRLNADAISDFVLLCQDQPAPLLMLSAPASVFVVNSTGDSGDHNLADGVCNDGSGQCTLRAAIEQANATAQADMISFNIPGNGIPVIRPTRALPAITNPVTLDGTTQPGGLVELNGARAGIAVDGLTIASGQTVVRGLVIHRFDKNGIRIENGGGNIIEGNFIGTDATGTLPSGNTFDGIWVNTAGNIIGGTIAAARNVIAGNGSDGIEIATGAAVGNIVRGNHIGTNATGTAVIPNAFHGVHINGAPNTTVGGATSLARNLISGNWDGIRITGATATGSVVQGNYIGTNATGSKVLGNSGAGVMINSVAGNLIGGPAAGMRNVISGNTAYGILLLNSNATSNRIQGNYIGTDAAGNVALSNGIGIFVNNAPGNVIGGDAVGAGNLIAGNGEGVRIVGSGATGNHVQGNLIGTNATGTAAIGNFQDGIVIQDAPGNLIGGVGSAARNVISGNQSRGVFITGNATETVVQGNYIGTNATGSAALGNAYHGVFINGAANNKVVENVLSGNRLFGILLYGSTATANRVQGNWIGSDPTGTNPIGNATGVFIAESANRNVIGPNNIIAFNQGDGVYVQSGTSNLITANSIFNNAAMGINLAPGGPTPNDDTSGNEDSDEGANQLQNWPSLNQATMQDRIINVSYSVTSALHNSAYPLKLEFFRADATGQGHTYLGSDIYTASDRMGSFTKTISLLSPVVIKHGDRIVATAIDKNGNTSEFSFTVATQLR